MKSINHATITAVVVAFFIGFATVILLIAGTRRRMFLQRIKLQNLLSFGDPGIDLELRPLNLLIGPNGSGKSNLIDAISLLQAAPRDLAEPVREGGGIREWIHKEARPPLSSVSVRIGAHKDSPVLLVHSFCFFSSSSQFRLQTETIESINQMNPVEDSSLPPYFYEFSGDKAIVFPYQDSPIKLTELPPDKSGLALVRDPVRYPDVSYLADEYSRIRIYRDWRIGRGAELRQFQRADERNDFLLEDCSNLGMILNKLRRYPDLKEKIRESLHELYPEITDFDLIIEGGSVQVFLQEGMRNIPATRLSDGTLRYLCLLAVLCQPKPPPLICIEEPELGLHPDVHVAIAKLLKEASTRTQLIVTTHSEVLVDCFSETPEDVVVCEKHEGQSQFKRLNKDELSHWLKDYSLGTLWTQGQIGGNRW